MSRVRITHVISLAVCALALTPAFTQPAMAATLYTSPLTNPGSGTAFCLAANVGKKPVKVTIDVLNAGGVVNNTDTETIEPGHVSGGPAVALPSGFGYCRFTFDGGKKNIRGSFISYGPGPTYSVYEVLPAQ